MSIRKSDTKKFLERITGGPVTLGKLMESIRLGEELSQVDFAKRLKVSRSHLNDIEKGNKAVSPKRAAKFANRSVSELLADKSSELRGSV